jgi:hypothetical protein
MCCEKHPELLGVRRIRDGHCFKCIAEWRKEYKSRPEVRAKLSDLKKRSHRIKSRALLEAQTTARAAREEAIAEASRQYANMSRWREFYKKPDFGGIFQCLKCSGTGEDAPQVVCGHCRGTGIHGA